MVRIKPCVTVECAHVAWISNLRLVLQTHCALCNTPLCQGGETDLSSSDVNARGCTSQCWCTHITQQNL